MEGDVEELDERLRELKRRGAAVLLLDGPATGPVCDRLLGSERLLRRHLFVRSLETPHAERESTVRDPETYGCVDVMRDAVRSTAESAQAPSGVPAPPDPVDPVESTEVPRSRVGSAWYSRVAADGGLDDVAAHVSSHLARFEAAVADPGEVRVCVDSLDPFVECYGVDELAAFVETTATRVRDVRGIAHYHLSATLDDDRLQRLRPQFDAVVETRQSPDGPQQRWSIAGDVRTDWLPV